MNDEHKAAIAVLEKMMETVCKKLDALNGKLEQCPVYKDRVDNHTKQLYEVTREVGRMTEMFSNIKGKFYAISVLIGLGSSIISGTIVFLITRLVYTGGF